MLRRMGCTGSGRGGPGRGRVRICCKGAPGRDRRREEPRNINVSPPALRCDPGLCNRFGQTAPPRAPGGLPRAGWRPRRAPPGAETCTSHSKVQFQPSFSSAKRVSRVQNAPLDEEEAGRGRRGPRRRPRPHHAPARPRHHDHPHPQAAVPGEKGSMMNIIAKVERGEF